MIFIPAGRIKSPPFRIGQPLTGKSLIIFVQPTVKMPVNNDQRQGLQNPLHINTVFEISFSYSGRKCRTKVLRTTYGNGDSIYKVALAGALSPTQRYSGYSIKKEDGRLSWVRALRRG
jgi:hypothetical protein